jgi:pimeloyl-ACP methyl ester carboxylesterase
LLSTIENLAGPAVSRDLDVVLLHGLNGDPRTVWRNSKGVLWPAWLTEDYQGSALWSLQYEASSSQWGGGSAMALSDRAVNLLAQMQSRDIGNVPIVFIGHSMGGLMVKQMLQTASWQLRFERILESAAGVAFLATPHLGADLADVADRFRRVYRTTPAIGDLKKNTPMLRSLNEWYQSRAPRLGLKTVVLRESRKTRGVLVVDEVSANVHLPDVPCVAVDADHTTIAQAENRDALQYNEIARLIEAIYSGGSSSFQANVFPSVDMPADRVAVTMIEPALRMGGTRSYGDVQRWFDAPVEQGRNFDTRALLFRGRVNPPMLGGKVLIRILTDRWYIQPEGWIREDGTFESRVYLDGRKPPVRFEIVVVSADGVEMHRGTARLE